MWTFDILAEFVGSLAVIGMLVVGFGAVRRTLPGTAIAPALLGILFGVVASIQMFQPLTLADGVIVDARTIPVALAGAFLGLRGLILCMAIAVATRVGIGGIGWSAGVASILLAGMAGSSWAKLTATRSHRGMSDLLLLAGMMSSHVLGALLLPSDIAIDFILGAMPVVLLLNGIAVPAIGALLEREYSAMQDEADARAAALSSAEWGLMALPDFLRTLGQLIATGGMGSGVGLLSIRLDGGLRGLLWGGQVRAHLVADLTRRVRDLIPGAAVVGEAGSGHFVVALPASIPAEGVAVLLREEVVGRVVAVPGSADVSLPVSLKVTQFDHLPSSAEVSAFVGLRRWLSRPDPRGESSWTARDKGDLDEPATSPRLFRIAGDLIAQNVTDGRHGRAR